MKRAPVRGFTLLELILASGLAFALFAALYQALALQSQYARIAREEMTRPQVARVLLHRIADELRSVAAPGAPPRSAPVVHASVPSFHGLTDAPLPFHADRILRVGDLAATSATIADQRDLAYLAVPESFAILGRKDRLLLRTERRPRRPSIDWTTDPLLATSAERTNVESEWKVVLYMAVPVRADEEDIAESFLDEDASPPSRCRGLVRQEIRLPHSPLAYDELVARLEELVQANLALAEEGALPTAESATSTDAEAPAPIPRSSTDNAAPKEVEAVVTQPLAPQVTRLRFRYHDGFVWRDAWERTDQLPAAVEIALSFDEGTWPLFDDPSTDASAGLSDSPVEPLPPTGAVGVDDEKVVVYRLVVALQPHPTQASAKPIARAPGLDIPEAP